jgi:uncharacterized protein
LSVSEDRTVQSTPTPITLVSAPGIADPGPLGLAAFALTTFLLSAANANWMTHATGNAFLGYALAYGGLAQLCAAMWEFRNRNVVGATGFGTFAAFWIGLAFYVLLVARPALTAAAAHPLTLPATVAAIHHDEGWILLGFAVFTLYATILISQTNTALFTTFFLLLVTLIILFIAFFNLGSATTSGLLQTGGYIGLATALAAWYTSAAGMAAYMGGKIKIPVGPPLLRP